MTAVLSRGRVTDQSGAVVPDAAIRVIQVQTNSTLTFIANEEGPYIAPNLPMGTYRLVIQKTGFGTLVREPVEVRPAVKVGVDLSLQLGEITETVNVSAMAPLLDVSATSNSTGLTYTTIEELPLIVSAYQRAITDLLPNIPGFTSGSSFVPRASGGAAGDTEVFIDGGPASEWGIARGGLSEVSPLIEQVGEFSVVSNGFNAERANFKLGADFINPFNIVRWGNPNTPAGIPTFGMITSTQGSRQIQINMELNF